MAYAAWSVVANEQPSTAKWNILGTNDSSFNDGTGIGTNAIAAASLATNAITLGYAQITSTFNSSAISVTAVTGLSSSVTIPAGSRRIKITVYSPGFNISSGSNTLEVSIWDGTVGSGTKIAYGNVLATGAGSTTIPGCIIASVTPSAGAKTYNVGAFVTAGSFNIVATSSNLPAFILVEAI